MKGLLAKETKKGEEDKAGEPKKKNGQAGYFARHIPEGYNGEDRNR
jgi:hypothetical protein